MSSDQHGHMFPMSEMRNKDDNAKKTNTNTSTLNEKYKKERQIKIQRKREILDKNPIYLLVI